MKLATLCYIKQNNKTLMLYRNKKENDIHKGIWNGVGGKFEPNETPEECTIREVKEETNLDVKNLKLKGLLTFPNFLKGEDWYVFVYLIDDFEGELIESCKEGHLEWIDDDKILDLNLWEGDKYFLKLVDENKFFSGKLTYINKKLVDYKIHINGEKLEDNLQIISN